MQDEDRALDKAQNATADYLRAAFFWHFDGYMSPMPIRASLLSAKVLSPPGTGDTDFANTYAAYEALSDADKTFSMGWSPSTRWPRRSSI